MSCLLAGVITPAPAGAIRLQVRSRATLHVQVDRRNDGLHMQGRATDENGAPLAGQAVEVRARGLRAETVVTDAAGAFDVLVRAADAQALRRLHGARLAWTAHLAPSRTHGAAEAVGELDLSRTPTRLSVAISPARVVLHAQGVRARVSLHAQGRPLQRARVRLRVGEGPALAGETGDDGAATFRLLPSALDRAGALLVRATYAGTGRFAPAQAERRLEVVRPTRLTLRVGREGSASGGRYRFSGRLVDAHGPLRGAPIIILAAPTRPPSETAGPAQDRSLPVASPGAPEARAVALTVTDDEGLFLATTTAQGFRATVGPAATVRAVYRPPAGAYAPAESPTVRLAVPPAGGIPASWYALALVWVLAAVGLVRVARPARAWLRARRATASVEAPAAAHEDLENPPLLAPPAAPHTHARPDHVAGHVVDAHSGLPLAGATVSCRRQGPGTGDPHARDRSPGAQRVPPAGAFEFGPLAPGRYDLSVRCPGYVSRSAEVACPHRGDLDGVKLQLVASKRRVRDLLFAACRALQVDARWGRDTPAEACRAAGRGPADAPPGGGPGARGDTRPPPHGLATLRTLTEEAWFAQRALTDEEVELAETIFHTLTAPPPPPGAPSPPPRRNP